MPDNTAIARALSPIPNWVPDIENILFLDFETFSPLDLPKVGTWQYLSHPESQILMASYARGKGATKLWDCWFSEAADAREWTEQLCDPTVMIAAFNAPFEREVIRHKLKLTLPPERFLCVQWAVYCLSYAKALEDVCAQAGLNADQAKLKDGKALVLKFGSPRTASQNDSSTRWTPLNAYEDWMRFRAYCIRDTDAQRTLYLDHVLPEITAIDDVERRIWCEHTRIQERGIPVDKALIAAGIHYWNFFQTEFFRELQVLTGVENPNSRAQLLTHFNNNPVDPDFHISNLQAATIARYLEDPNLHPTTRRTLELRAAVTRTSLAKFGAMQRSMYEETIRQTLQCRGASRTGRDAGRGVQPQNIVRGFLKNPDEDGDLLAQGEWQALQARYPNVSPDILLSWCIRPAFSAPPGHRFYAADLASIETAVISWITSCKVLQETFQQGLDAYVLFATWVFGVAYGDVTKEQRTFSKPGVLGGVFRMSARALVEYADSMGIEMSEIDAARIVQILRDRYHEIERFWWWLDDALPWIVDQPPGTCVDGYRCTFERTAHYLKIHLPSGRPILYKDPVVEWDGRFERWSWSFVGWNSYAYSWRRQRAHGGIITENIVQATARDLLYRVALPRMIERKLDIRWLVHDEAVGLAPETQAEDCLRVLLTCLTESPDWPGAEDLFLGAEGDIFRRYRKG